MEKETENNWLLRLSKGPAAAHTYLILNDQNCCQLTLDWSYDGVYFKYHNDKWITLSIGPLTKTHDLYKIDTEDKLKVFKLLATDLNKLENYSINSDKSLIKLKELVNNLTQEYNEINTANK